MRQKERGVGDEAGPSLSAYLATATLILSVFSGHFDMLPGSPPLNRLALVALVVVCLPHLIAGRHAFRAVHLVLGLQAVWALGSAIWAGTVSQPVSFFALLDQILVPAVLIVLAPVAFARQADRELLLKCVTVLGLYLGLVSVPQALGRPELLFPRYLAEGVTAGQIDRAGGPFLEAAGNGAALAMCIPMALLLARYSHGWWRRIAVLSVGLCAVGGLVTFTRSVWLACVAAFVIYFVLERQLRRKLPVLLAGLGVAVAGLLAVMPGLYQTVVDRLSTQRSIDDRTTTNAAALSMLHEHPFTGVGWGRFLEVVDDYVRQQDLVPLTATHIIAHNVVLSRAAELGAVGALLLILALVTGPVRASLSAFPARISEWQRVLLAMFASWLIVAMLTPMGYTFPDYLLWTVTGLVLQSWGSRVIRRRGPDAASEVALRGLAGKVPSSMVPRE